MSCIQTRGLAYGQISYRDLDIEEGKATFISGPSGCGKSTLLRLFNKTLAPTAGTVLYRGQDMAQTDSIALRRDVLLAGQSVFLFEGHRGRIF
jgi:ABC-type proline/glycine betaine transport systems, ATPase components